MKSFRNIQIVFAFVFAFIAGFSFAVSAQSAETGQKNGNDLKKCEMPNRRDGLKADGSVNSQITSEKKAVRAQAAETGLGKTDPSKSQ